MSNGNMMMCLPVLGVFNDLFAHPAKMIGAKRFRQPETSVLWFLLDDVSAAPRHFDNQQSNIFHGIAPS